MQFTGIQAFKNMEEGIQVFWPHHSRLLRDGLRDLFSSGQLSDLSVQMHSMILYLVCPHLRDVIAGALPLAASSGTQSICDKPVTCDDHKGDNNNNNFKCKEFRFGSHIAELLYLGGVKVPANSIDQFLTDATDTFGIEGLILRDNEHVSASECADSPGSSSAGRDMVQLSPDPSSVTVTVNDPTLSVPTNDSREDIPSFQYNATVPAELQSSYAICDMLDKHASGFLDMVTSYGLETGSSSCDPFDDAFRLLAERYGYGLESTDDDKIGHEGVEVKNVALVEIEIEGNPSEYSQSTNDPPTVTIDDDDSDIMNIGKLKEAFLSAIEEDEKEFTRRKQCAMLKKRTKKCKTRKNIKSKKSSPIPDPVDIAADPTPDVLGTLKQEPISESPMEMTHEGIDWNGPVDYTDCKDQLNIKSEYSDVPDIVYVGLLPEASLMFEMSIFDPEDLHKALEWNTKIQCRCCGYKTYGGAYYMKLHLTEHYPEEAVLECRICERKFGSKVTFKSHLLQHLRPDEYLVCRHCTTYKTHRRRLLIQHVAKQHKLHMNGSPIEEGSECPHCQFVLTKPGSMPRHIVRNHAKFMDKPFQCRRCKFASSDWPTLKVHIRRKHKIKQKRKKSFGTNTSTSI